MTPIQAFSTMKTSLSFSLPSLNTTLVSIQSPIQTAMTDCLSSLSPAPVSLLIKTSLLAYAYSLHCKMDHQTALPRQIFLALATVHTIHTGLFSCGPTASLSSTMLKVAAAALLISYKQGIAPNS